MTRRLTIRCALVLCALLSSVAWADRPARPNLIQKLHRHQAGVQYDYEQLGKPKSAVDAFNTLLTSGSGPAQVRRFSDANPMAWNMVLDVLASAKPGKELKSSFFTTEKDPYGWAYLGGLLFAQMRGVKVTHLNDWSANARGRGFVSYLGGLSVLQELARYGSTVGVFNTPGKRLARFFKYGLSYGLIGCNHDKVLVANPGTDEAQGCNGGRNIGRAYFQDPRDNPAAWRDDTIQVKGNEACTGLAKAVDREVEGAAMKLVKAPTSGESRSREMLAAYALMEEWVSRAPLSAEQKAQLRADPKARAALAEKVLGESTRRLQTMISSLPADIQKTIPTALGKSAARNIGKLATALGQDLELCGTRGSYQKLGGFMKAQVKFIDQIGAADAAPKQRFNEMAPDLHHLINGAQKHITIINPYVVLTEEMVQAFEAGAKRGVQYRIVTNSPMSTDSAITQGFFLNNWANVLARVPTMQVWVATGKRKIHAKAFVVDNMVTGDTTYNADLLSGLVNGECGTISLSKRVAADLQSAVNKDITNPDNGFKQWTIKKDASGQAILDAKGKPIVVEGPHQDLSWRLRAIYAPVKALCKLIAATPAGAPLRLQQAKDVLPAR
jgi:cardiolipin synthase C